MGRWEALIIFVKGDDTIADTHLKIENKLVEDSYVTSVGCSKPNVSSV